MADGKDNELCGAGNLAARRPTNRPGLPQVAYRIGTQPEFLARMKWRIQRQTVVDPDTGVALQPLAGLRTRETRDPTIALMDSFAATLDVLSFYTERIANEGYLGTATQRRSMVELGRMIGYEPSPGVAASVHLRFTVEASDDPYRSIEVPAGVQAMSVPQAKGELPQVFETIAPIVARAEWNAMPARTEHDQALTLYWNAANASDADNGRIFLFDLENSFDVDPATDPSVREFTSAAQLDLYHPLSAEHDLAAALASLVSAHELNPEVEPMLRAIAVDEIFLRGIGLGLRPGQRIVVIGVRVGADESRHIVSSVLRVIETSDDREFGVTRLIATPHGSPPDAVRRAPGRRAPRLKRLVMPTVRLAFDRSTVDSYVRTAAWSGRGLSALVRSQGWSRLKLMRLIRLPRHVDAPETSAAQPGLYLLREDTGFFGSTATRQETLAKQDEANGNPYPDPWDENGGRTIWTDSQGRSLPGNVHVFIEREIKEILPDGWVAIETPDNENMVFRVAAAATWSRADYAMSAKSTALTFRKPDGGDVVIPAPSDPSPLNDFRFRTAHIFAASVPLALAGTPIREDIEAGVDAIDLASLFIDLERGQQVSIAGARSDADGLTESETLTISDVVHIGGHTRLLLEAGPEFSYRRASVTVNANMAPATHGERQEEPLGSGDAAAIHQRFKLAKAPLTHVSADTPEGRVSTLEVRVDGVLWREVPTLFDAGPDDRVYELRREDDGSSWIEFGDGVQGHRLPTGEMNVTAVYRAGIGHAGEVPDEAIIQLKTRPIGIRAVTNPSRSSGSAEPETLDAVKRSAPRSVKTLGRIVSLTDYEDFAANYAGVGKARADSLWAGGRQLVLVGIGPDSDTLLDPGAPLLVNLRAAADKVRDDSRWLIVAPCQRRFFQLSIRVMGHADYRAADVEAAVRAALIAGFSYEARRIAQPVSAVEVIALAQAVPGVVGVDLDTLAPIDGTDPAAPPTLMEVLPALPARIDANGKPAAAELLTLLESATDVRVEAANA
jgi:hypothetical protein